MTDSPASPPRRRTGVGEILARLLLGGYFLAAGAVKLQDPASFLDSVRTFQILPDPWASYVALGLPWLEVFAGLGVIFRKIYSGSLLVLTGSLFVFMAALIRSWSLGLDVNCGCFGKADFADSYPEYIARDVILLLPALWLIYRLVRVPRPGVAAAPESAAHANS